MDLQKISVKVFVDEPVSIDLDAVVAVFHEWIRSGAVEGLLIDVADYQHVPDGPGVVLIAHEYEYAIDFADGKAGLLLRTKRRLNGDVRDRFRTAIRLALLACQKLASQPSLEGLRFRTSEMIVGMFDRLATPNADESFTALRADVEHVAAEVYEGVTFGVERVDNDPRQCLTIRVTAPQAPDLGTLVDRLTAGASAAG